MELNPQPICLWNACHIYRQIHMSKARRDIANKSHLDFSRFRNNWKYLQFSLLFFSPSPPHTIYEHLLLILRKRTNRSALSDIYQRREAFKCLGLNDFYTWYIQNYQTQPPLDNQCLLTFSVLYARGVWEIEIEPDLKAGMQTTIHRKNYVQDIIDNQCLKQILKAMGLQRKDKSFHLGAKRSD